MLKRRVLDYLSASGCPKSVFCRRLNISYTHFYKWLNDERRLSDELENRIKDYLSENEIKR